MTEPSTEEMLDWDISQKTVTTWSSQVSAKAKVRKTYSNRQGRCFLKRSSSLPVTSTLLDSDEEDAATVNGEELEEGGGEFDIDSPAIPPIPGGRTFARSNSVDHFDRQQPPRLTRSQSISVISGRRRSASTSLLSDFNENVDPNFDSLSDFISPKRSKPVRDLRGRKKVRSETNNPKIPLSTSFSNLARFGGDGLSWARPSAKTEKLLPFMRDSIAKEFEFFDVTETSPATTVGSRKRGICESPLDDFDDCSFSAPSVHRRSRSRISPPTNRGDASNCNLTPAGPMTCIPSRLTGSAESQQKRDIEFDTDDGESLSDGNQSDDSIESNTKTPMQQFTPYGSVHRRQSSMSFFPDNMLEPGKSGPDDVIKSMPSYQDLRFLVKSLRKENSGSRTSWHVAPPVAWDSSRRAAFFQWTTRSLGFSFRSGGMAIAYLQISKTKGAGILELLGSAASVYKQRGLGENTPKDTTEKRSFAFPSSKDPLNTSVSRTLSLTPKELTSNSWTHSFVSAASTNNVDDSLLEGMKALGIEEKNTPHREHHHPISSIIYEDSDDVSFHEASRPSLENHQSATDLMAHLHGMTPVPRKGRPPRLSFDSMSMGSVATHGTASKYSAASPYLQPPMSTVGGKSIVNDFVMTPCMKPQDQGWGSCPVEGRDWGTSEPCDPVIIEELSRRFEKSCIDAGFVDDDDVSPPAELERGTSTGSSLFDLELEAASGYRDTAQSPDSNCEVESSMRSSLSTTVSPVQIGTSSESFANSSRHGFDRAKEYRRRQTSFAKHTRMSLIASAINPTGSMLQGRKSLFIRAPQTSFRPSEVPLLEKLDMEPAFAPQDFTSSEELYCSQQAVLNDDAILETIFGFLQETELLCTASLVASKWSDAAAQAHANMMLISVGCLGNSEESEDYDSDDEEPVVEKALAVPGLMEREWNYLVSTFPWACFLSEGAFKRVYKVFNSTHRVEEAVSVMDVDMIESTGNMSVVGAELAVSVLLSSLVRRGVCPNFVVTRGVFSCVHEPPARHWGTSDNKRPKGSLYVSPKVKRLPKEPASNKSGRYQYIRMELCDQGDAEEFLKRQPDEAVSTSDATQLLFQIAFALHAAADRFSLKHYDVKLLNIFLQGVKSETQGDVIHRYGLGEHTFALRSAQGCGLIAKLADYGTANIDSGSCGQPVTIGQFTTLENTPIDFLILGDDAYQSHGHDCFGLGLCMLHLFTGHAPYEEILEDVSCPQNLKKGLRLLWENDEEAGYSVIRSLILADVYKDEEGHIVEGEPDEVLYDTLYRFLVLFGLPELPARLNDSMVWDVVKRTLAANKTGRGKGSRSNGTKKNQRNDVNQYNRDRRKYSLASGTNKYIARARNALKSTEGGMDLLLSLVSFDPQSRATALDVLNSSFMTILRESGETIYGEHDEVFSYNAFST